jgi:hypothetical protein
MKDVSFYHKAEFQRKVATIKKYTQKEGYLPLNFFLGLINRKNRQFIDKPNLKSHF